MFSRKSLVFWVGLLALSAMLILRSMAPAPVTAQGPTPQATEQAHAPIKLMPPVAVLQIVPIPANPADKNAITSTLQVITDTKVGGSPAVVAMGTTGETNDPVGMKVALAVRPQNPANPGKPTWTLTKPADSKAAIKDPAAMDTEFTPDVPGAYKVDVVLKNDAGTSELVSTVINASTFVGVKAGNCKTCHANKYNEWAETGHARILTDNIDNLRTPNTASHYTESCIRCHTTGYSQPGKGNGGFNDIKTADKWNFPTLDKIDAAGKKTGPSNFAAMPDNLKDMANIGCEQCHGPASQHVATGAKTMAVSYDNGVCNVCHAGGGHHIKGLEIVYSAHSDGDAAAFNTPVGPAEQACVRCHSGKGYVSFLATPTNPAAWDNEKQTIGCSTCHDPHADKNYAQLRIAGKPVAVPFTPKDVGLSATCEECHNNRTNPADATKGSYPHYSSAAEMLTDTGGVTYGQNVPNSPHGAMVGAAPIPNPAAASDPEAAKFLYSKPGDTKGNVPGPCVTCHMTAGMSDAKDPNYMKVGEHSFNMVSPDGKLDFGAACKSCHGAVTDFNIKAKADYDGNGKVEGVQDEVKGLLNVLWKQLEAKGFKKNPTGYPYATLPANADDKMKNAWYNYRYVYGVMWGVGDDGKPTVGGEGKAAAIHNFKRSVSLLQLSLKDLTGSLPAGMTELK